MDFPAVAVCSGKGGVGKTLISSTLVQELGKYYKRVGAFDADYSNPNLGRFLRIDTDIRITEDKKLLPASSDNISFFSIEKVVGDKGVGMKGEDYAEITRDIIQYAQWNVDVMVVDLPAVIADEWRAVLSVFDERYLGSIVVAQPSHLETTERVLKLHQLNGVPVIGLVENMVGFKCEHGTEYQIFGPSGVDELSKAYNVPVLAKIPVQLQVQEMLMDGNSRVRVNGDHLVTPIVDAVLTAKPKKLGFLQEAKQRLKEISRDVVVKGIASSVIAINRSVNIGELQKKYMFMDESTIAMTLLNRDGTPMKDIKGKPTTYNFRISNGKLLMVAEPKEVDIQLMIKADALVWSLLGKKKFPDGTTVPYTILDAYVNGDARVFGAGAVVKAIRFFRELYEQSRGAVLPQIQPLLEELA